VLLVSHSLSWLLCDRLRVPFDVSYSLRCRDPTVGAQYRWSANFAPTAPRFWGLLQGNIHVDDTVQANLPEGWITVAAWCFACGGPPSILANTLTSLAIFNNEQYVPERWHTSLVMIAVMALPIICNLWFRKILNTFETIGGLLHIILFVVFIAILAALGPRSKSDFVFKTLTSDVSGWNNPGVSWGLGLLSMTFSVTGADSVLHMCMLVRFPACCH
jgi:choline transport protein